jgi:carbonic anhydrase
MALATRRSFLQLGAGLAASFAAAEAVAGCSSGRSNNSPSPSLTPAVPPVVTPTSFPADGDAALQRLMAGNARFVSGRPAYYGRDTARSAAIAESQKPYAIILGCADSRVVPEIIFDEGLGDLFLVRVAGNTGDDPILRGTIEYGVAVLGSILLMVLGHENCGAAKAAVDAVTKGASVPGDIPAVLAPMLPAARAVSSQPADARVDATIRKNVQLQADSLKASSAILKPAITAGRLKVVGAEYVISTGQVKLLT